MKEMESIFCFGQAPLYSLAKVDSQGKKMEEK